MIFRACCACAVLCNIPLLVIILIALPYFGYGLMVIIVLNVDKLTSNVCANLLTVFSYATLACVKFRCINVECIFNFFCNFASLTDTHMYSVLFLVVTDT